MRKPVRSLALLSVAALAVGLGLTGSANAAKPGEPEVIAKGVPSPLSLAVAKDGSAYVTANFAGMLWHVAKGQPPEILYQTKEKNAEVGGVSRYQNTLTFTITGKNKVIKQMVNGGKPTTLADVGKYEATKNPDKGVTYGLQGATAECIAQWPVKDARSGDVHRASWTRTRTPPTRPTRACTSARPPATTSCGSATTARSRRSRCCPRLPWPSRPRPPRRCKIPACAVGLEYWFEPVPTDVELGPDGWLYVSSLPGGPEDGSLGAQGRVYKVNPKSGKVKLVADGFISTVDVAVAGNGDVYVAELFTGMIKRIKAGSSKAKPFAQLAMVGAIEYTKGYLYATDKALIGEKNPKGTVVRIPL